MSPVQSSSWHWLSPRSWRIQVPTALLTIVALIYVEGGRRVVPSPDHQLKLQAAQRSADAAQHLRQQRLERGVFVDPINDPGETGLIGQEYSQITTDRGDLEAKLASTDPNFAAVVVDMLRELGLGRGDCVALAFTGSFPALNLSTLAAVEALELRPVLISSVGASNFGATDPYFTWLDMEQSLAAAGLFSTRSLAASPGGSNDQGRGLSPKGRELLAEAANRNGVPLLRSEQLEASIQRRVELYRKGCDPGPVAAYVNVGGGVASLGHSLNANLIPNGASSLLPRRNYPARGALLRLAEEGVPVIHLLNIRQLAASYGLLAQADSQVVPGQGEVYGVLRYSMTRTLVATSLLLGLLVGLYLFDRHVHRLGQAGPEAEHG